MCSADLICMPFRVYSATVFWLTWVLHHCRSVAVQPSLGFAPVQHSLGPALARGNAKGMDVQKAYESFSSMGGNKKDTSWGEAETPTFTVDHEMKQAAATEAECQLKQWKAQTADKIYVLPLYYPRCAKRSATCNQSVETLLDRLIVCFKKLNIQARFEHNFPTFGLVLRTPEQLELSLLIWYADRARDSLYVELDKRQCGNGCGGAFPFQYVCRILKTVSSPCPEDDSICLPQHIAKMQGKCNAEQLRKVELLVSSCEKREIVSCPLGRCMFSPEKADSCLRMTWTFLQSCVTWCKGMDLLNSLSDPNKTSLSSAQVVSKVILLGTPASAGSADCCQGIHESLISMLQILSADVAADSTEQISLYQKDCLLQLVLASLVNAMEVQVKFSAENSSADNHPVLNEFLASAKSCNILEKLTNIMRHADSKPHHAYLAVKALFLLSSDISVRSNVSLAMIAQDGSTVATEAAGNSGRCAALQQAQEIGNQTHAMLEAECERLQRVLDLRL